MRNSDHSLRRMGIMVNGGLRYKLSLLVLIVSLKRFGKLSTLEVEIMAKDIGSSVVLLVIITQISQLLLWMIRSLGRKARESRWNRPLEV